MALQVLPEGFSFRVKAIDTSKSAGVPVVSSGAVRITIESVDGVVSEGWLDATGADTESAFTELVEARAASMADDFTQARNLKQWVEANYPDA